MCTTQTLAYTAEGYIVRCASCGRMQLAFGVAALTLSRHQFNRLRRKVLMAQEYHAFTPDRNLKCVSLPVSSNLILCLSVAELQALADLTSQASALLEVYQWLDS